MVYNPDWFAGISETLEKKWKRLAIACAFNKPDE
jgi:hypothetical protein